MQDSSSSDSGQSVCMQGAEEFNPAEDASTLWTCSFCGLECAHGATTPSFTAQLSISDGEGAALFLNQCGPLAVDACAHWCRTAAEEPMLCHQDAHWLPQHAAMRWQACCG